jgi:UDP-N-acetyl-D-mannosaminuronic acid dehydrogenase
LTACSAVAIARLEYEGRMKKVAIIGGCGHAGLPLAIAFAPHHRVVIYDIDQVAVERVRRGEMPFRDEGAAEALRHALTGGMEVSSSPECLSTCDIVVVVIGTPVDEHLNPSFTAIERLLEQLSARLHAGQTVVLRSTVFPGSSERIQRFFERKGIPVEVAFCPERVAEGVALQEIRKLPQIVSSFSAKGLEAAKTLFAPLGVELIELAPLEAELAKIFNNVYRYITFSVANQFFMLSSDAGVDFYKILHAMKHNYPRAANMPSPGLTAGPCLFKDTMQMSAFDNNNFFLGHAAMLVNEGLPQFIVNRMKRRWPELQHKTVGVLGMAFKAESDDARESLSYKLKKILSLHCGNVLTADPFVIDAALVSEPELLERSDIFVIGAPHRRYRELSFGDKPVVDIWNHLGRGASI